MGLPFPSPPFHDNDVSGSHRPLHRGATARVRQWFCRPSVWRELNRSPLLLPLKPDGQHHHLLGGDCRQVPLEDHQALHEDPRVLSSKETEVLHENCNSLVGKRASKNTATSSPPFLCLVCLTCSCDKKTVTFPAKRGLLRTILSFQIQTTSVQDQHTPSQAFPPGLGAPSVFL